ncbi:MAG: CRISPR system precrRNA processing endoribonuclease RAMP protein Cas6 [Desulfamplus sp.]|nr:CRISPR system precrRNA processing endoribonuclease RAMP protein Cas6 [Desulfamplus sp.]
MLNSILLHDLHPAKLFPEMQLGRYRFTLKFKRKIQTSLYQGAALRGLLGHSLVEIECPFRKKDCNHCSLHRSCAYYTLYESRSKNKCFVYLPRPYIISPVAMFDNQQKNYQPENRESAIFKSASSDGISLLDVDITLIGHAGEHLSSVIAAWDNAGKKGLIIGNKTETFTLESVMCIHPGTMDTSLPLLNIPDGGEKQSVGIDSPGNRQTGQHKNSAFQTVFQKNSICSYDQTVYPLADYLTLDSPIDSLRHLWKIYILTPLRLRDKGKNLGNVEWSNAFNSLAIRLSVLNQYYCGGERTDPEQWERLLVFFRDPGRTYDSTEWKDIKRYSSRQKARIFMSGIQGECIVEPPSSTLDLWWQWWQMAELFHLGKGITMGLGKIHPVMMK